MSIFLSPNLPANVVEIGNEITQTKINEINSGTLATQTYVTTNFAPKASPTFTGTVTIPSGASISGYLTTASASTTYLALGGGTLIGNLVLDDPALGFPATLNGALFSFSGGLAINIEEAYINGFNIQNCGQISFADSTVQSTAAVPYTYDPKKAIANACASCMYINNGYIAFDGGVALALNSSSKFSGGGQYRLGWTSGGSYSNTFSLTSWTNPNGDIVAQASNGGYLSLSGEMLAYSDDAGSTWTYSDFTF